VRAATRSQRQDPPGQAPAVPAGRDTAARPGGDGATPAGDDATVVRIGTPSSLLALVPQLMGFEPRLSIVVIGTRPPRGRVELTLRFDLPPVPDPGAANGVAGQALSVLAAQGFQSGVAIGYGPGRLVTPVADALRRLAAGLGFRLTEILRAEDGRYWSYLCDQPSCCPAEGVPYSPPGHPVTAQFAAAGAPPVLAGRAEMAATVAPVEGAAARSMDAATRRAEDRASLLIARAATSGRRGAGRRLLAGEGLDAVRRAIDAYRAGDRIPSDDEAAWLAHVLLDLRVRDDAWARMDPAFVDEHLRLWTDITRLARPGYVAPAAALLAFVAWQSGNGALANMALDRAAADNPGYSMAILLREVISAGTSPHRALLPLTPEEVAASYAEADEALAAQEDPGADGESGMGTGWPG
jgi:hypothetical protein